MVWEQRPRQSWTHRADIMPIDVVCDCIRGVHTGRYTYVRKLRDEGKLDEAQMLFFAESKPVEELYDYLADPFCLHNLAERLRCLAS